MADPIIDLQTTVADKAPARASFGTPLIVGFHTRFANRIREYAEASDMLTDGFTTADPEYKAALVLKAQKPTPPKFKVGRLSLATFTDTVTLAPTITTQGYKYPGVINGTDATLTVGASATVATICTALAAIINPITGAAAAATATEVTVTHETAGSVLSFSGLSEAYTVKHTTTINASNLQADLTAINDEDSDWYGFGLTMNSDQALTAAAAWCEANGKVFAMSSGNSEIINTGVTNDVASTLVASSYSRCSGIWHPDIGSSWANFAYLAVNLTPDPGSYTPAFKELVGVRALRVKQAAKTALQTKNWTRYGTEYGLNITYEGKTPSGRFWDVTRFLDWQDYVIKANYYAWQANAPKRGFTNKDLAGLQGNIKGSLLQGRTVGGWSPDVDIVVNVPTVSETLAADRAARIVKTVTWTAQLAGAQHAAVVRGSVSV